MTSITDLIVIGVETLRIDNGCSSEKELTKLICMYLWMVLYLTINQVDSYHGCVFGPLTWDTKDILYMDECVLIITYEFLATRSLKCNILDTTWSPRRWLCSQDGIICPWYLMRLSQGMRCDEILGQGSWNIRRVLDDFLHASVLTRVIN